VKGKLLAILYRKEGEGSHPKWDRKREEARFLGLEGGKAFPAY